MARAGEAVFVLVLHEAGGVAQCGAFSSLALAQRAAVHDEAREQLGDGVGTWHQGDETYWLAHVLGSEAFYEVAAVIIDQEIDRG